MAKLSSFRTDPDKETEGVWFDFAEGIRFKVARWNNPKFRQLVEKLARPHARTFRRSGRRGEMWESIVKQAAARTILLDWENVEDDNGKPLKYSPDEALRVFEDPALKAIYEFVVETAIDESAYLQEDQEDAEKN